MFLYQTIVLNIANISILCQNLGPVFHRFQNANYFVLLYFPQNRALDASQCTNLTLLADAGNGHISPFIVNHNAVRLLKYLIRNRRVLLYKVQCNVSLAAINQYDIISQILCLAICGITTGTCRDLYHICRHSV